MKKDSLICFRTTRKLHESLTQLAREDQRSMSSTIEMVLVNYLKERKSFKGIEQEKRRYPRKAISLPAVINMPEPGRMGVGSIAEISLGGVNIIIPKDFRHQIRIDGQKSRFEIVFNLPEGNLPVCLTCESQRVVDAEDSVQVGASFVDADFRCYKTLQTYLI
ncbi:MAG: PilZ domain protein [Syntrophus sp. PtaB.Bin138]|nr:MAG: PilZ domain protein [Syntrophus sp. PtaB.Bin138]